MATARKFSVGDLVLVKFLKYGYWPAKITTVHANGRARFICYGPDESEGATFVKNIEYYDDSYKMKRIEESSIEKYPNLVKALDQISSESRKIEAGIKKEIMSEKGHAAIRSEDGCIVIGDDDEDLFEKLASSSNTRACKCSSNNHQCDCSQRSSADSSANRVQDRSNNNRSDMNPANDFLPEVTIRNNTPGSDFNDTVTININIQMPSGTFVREAPMLFAGLAKVKSASSATQPAATQMAQYDGEDRKQKAQYDEEDRKLYVGGLSPHTTYTDLGDYFQAFGEVESITVPSDEVTGRSRGFAFVIFQTPQGLENATATNYHKINGRMSHIEKAKSKPGKVFVGKLPTAGVDYEDVRDYFEQYGTVQQVCRPMDRSMNEANYCFVKFDNEKVAKNLVQQGTCTIKGHSMQIKDATNNSSMQRMLGGRGSFGETSSSRSSHGGGGGFRGGRGGWSGSPWIPHGHGGGFGGWYEGGNGFGGVYGGVGNSHSGGESRGRYDNGRMDENYGYAVAGKAWGGKRSRRGDPY